MLQVVTLLYHMSYLHQHGPSHNATRVYFGTFNNGFLIPWYSFILLSTSPTHGFTSPFKCCCSGLCPWCHHFVTRPTCILGQVPSTPLVIGTLSTPLGLEEIRVVVSMTLFVTSRLILKLWGLFPYGKNDRPQSPTQSTLLLGESPIPFIALKTHHTWEMNFFLVRFSNAAGIIHTLAIGKFWYNYQVVWF